MEANFFNLAKKSIRELVPYQPGKPVEELERELGITSSIKLASNENPLGPSPLAIQAIQKGLVQANIYPDGSYYEIKHALANELSLTAEQITMGNGSENILELIIKSYLQKGDVAVISEHAFIAIPLLLKGYGVTIKSVKEINRQHDIEKMVAAITHKTRILFLVNPNNPTGTYINDDAFRYLLNSTPPNVLIVVDEAYAEYIIASDYPHTLQYLPHYPNLVITRTFSKIYGLAALRLGYALSSPDIADILNRARLPFNVNSLAAKAGVAALGDKQHIKNSIELNELRMSQLNNGLNNLDIPFIPSIGNFITIEVKNGKEIYDKLLREGVIVRPLNVYNMPKHIRVTIGTPEENERFLTALDKVL